HRQWMRQFPLRHTPRRVHPCPVQKLFSSLQELNGYHLSERSPMSAKVRDTWASRIGIIMAVAGSAIGLGNFLRLPAKAASTGGGAFMIPYLVALLFLGLPLMWLEWTLGLYGVGYGHGTAPGIFNSVWR